MPMIHGNRTASSRARAAGKLLIAATAALAGTALAGELTIEVLSVMPNRGRVYVALYDQPEAFPITDRQRANQVLASDASHLTVHFKDLPPGRYAAAAFQDLNGNGKLDKNFLGIPKEPYGFSNGARGTAGPPKFADAAITLAPDGSATIVLK